MSSPAASRCGDLLQDPFRFSSGLNRARDLPSNHEVVRAIANGFARRGNALLIAARGAGGTDAGRDEEGLGSHDLAQPGGFERRCYQTIDAAIDSFPRSALDKLRDLAAVAEIVH